jgi:hypothetical protein
MEKIKLNIPQLSIQDELYRKLIDALKNPKMDAGIQNFLNISCNNKKNLIHAIAIRYKTSDEFIIEFCCDCKKSLKIGSKLILDKDSIARLEKKETVSLTNDVDLEKGEKELNYEFYQMMPLLCEKRLCAVFIYTNELSKDNPETISIYQQLVREMLSMKITDYIQYRELENRKNQLRRRK